MVAVPLFLLPARAVNLVLEMYLAPRCEQESGIKQLGIADIGVRPTDQIIAVAHGMRAKQLDVGRRVFRQCANSTGHIVVVHERQQLRGE